MKLNEQEEKIVFTLGKSLAGLQWSPPTYSTFGKFG